MLSSEEGGRGEGALSRRLDLGFIDSAPDILWVRELIDARGRAHVDTIAKNLIRLYARDDVIAMIRLHQRGE